MLIFIFLILTFWFWTDFGLRCVGTFYASVGENIQKKCHFGLHAHAYTTPFLFRVPQVLETWLTCVCWHVTWHSWIVSIEIVRKCLLNTRFSSFYFHLYLLRNSKVLFARAQRREMLDFVLLMLTLWFWLDFGVRCVGFSTLQWVRKFKEKCPFCLHSHAYITPCPFRVPQRGEILMFVFLILTLWFWSDLGARCIGTVYASAGEKIRK